MDERRTPRVVTDIEVDCIVGDRRRKVLVRDLSTVGCMVEGELLAEGDMISLALADDETASGRVVWARGRICGLTFARHLPRDMVEELGFRIADVDIAFPPVDGFGRPMPRLGPVPDMLN